MQHKTIHMVAFVLLAIGGLNWLLVGLFGLDLVQAVTASMGSSGAMIAKVVYIAVGVSAVYEVMTHKAHCTMCSA
jgi:uncharacterized protein